MHAAIGWHGLQFSKFLSYYRAPVVDTWPSQYSIHDMRPCAAKA